MGEKISVITEMLNSELIVILNSEGYFPNSNRFIKKLYIYKAAYQRTNEFRGKKSFCKPGFWPDFCMDVCIHMYFTHMCANLSAILLSSS